MHSDNLNTGFITLNTSRCTACWQCLNSCPAGVFGKVDLPWHRHALLRHPNDCTGCMTCTVSCKNGAITCNDTPKEKTVDKSHSLRLTVNTGLLLTAIAVTLSGFLLQAGYHMGGHGSIDTEAVYMGLNYFGWSAVHRITIIVITVLFAAHTYLHMTWYRSVLSGKKTRRSRQVLVLTLIFIFVALSGYLSWFIHIFNGSEMVRKLFIELHDKLTILLFIFLLLHIAGRFSWFRRALDNKNRDKAQ